MAEIKVLTELGSEERMKALSSVEEIFFLSTSVKNFTTDEKKSLFYKRWCRDYQTYFSEEFFIIFEAQRILGYLSGCSDSLKALEFMNVPGQQVFQDLFNEFPAHLHINFHPDARGRGLGSLLIEHYIEYLKIKGTAGVHLVTSPDAKNVKFYHRLNFVHTHIKELNNAPLYFMGRVLE